VLAACFPYSVGGQHISNHMNDEPLIVVYHLGDEVYAWRFRRRQVNEVVRSAVKMMKDEELSFSSRDLSYLVQILDKRFNISKEGEGDSACSD